MDLIKGGQEADVKHIFVFYSLKYTHHQNDFFLFIVYCSIFLFFYFLIYNFQIHDSHTKYYTEFCKLYDGVEDTLLVNTK